MEFEVEASKTALYGGGGGINITTHARFHTRIPV